LRPEPVLGDATRCIELPPAQRDEPATLMQALGLRRSTREFRADALPRQVLANLLWAADGVNRQGGGRTAPSALGANEIVVVAALREGAYAYDPVAHTLNLMAAADIRRVTGYQDFVDQAPLDLVYVVDHARMGHVPAQHRGDFASVAAGAISQNVSLYCSANGLATVLRAWIDREAIARALGLTMSQHVLLSQTVGLPL
jgi:nitroreductase